MKNRIKKVFKIIRNVICYTVVIVLVALTVFVMISNAKKEVPFFKGRSVMLVVTESMFPTIPGRSSILVEKVDPADIKVDDIIVFVSDDPAIEGLKNTHRVIEIVGDNEEFVTKGDNNAVNDKYTAKADKVIGRFVRVLPVLTTMSRLLASGTGLFIILLIIVGMILIMYLPGAKRSLKELEAKSKQDRQEMIDRLVQEEVQKMMEADKAKEEAEDPGEKTEIETAETVEGSETESPEDDCINKDDLVE